MAIMIHHKQRKSVLFTVIWYRTWGIRAYVSYWVTLATLVRPYVRLKCSSWRHANAPGSNSGRSLWALSLGLSMIPFTSSIPKIQEPWEYLQSNMLGEPSNLGRKKIIKLASFLDWINGRKETIYFRRKIPVNGYRFSMYSREYRNRFRILIKRSKVFLFNLSVNFSR